MTHAEASRVGQVAPALQASGGDQERQQGRLGEWLPFNGGELEARAPRRLCAGCRAKGHQTAGELHPTLCFECHRAERDRITAIRAAANLETASEARFQDTLPFEPVNRARLAQLKVERISLRETMMEGVGRFELRRRQALIAARTALKRAVEQVRGRDGGRGEERRAFVMAMHAVELQFPEAWVPYVVSR